MKHLLTLIISLIAMTASAQWNDTMGNYITWMEAEAPFGWNLFTVEEANEGDDSELLLVQYGAWKDGQMLNAFYPNGSIEGQCYIYQPDNNLLFHLKTHDGDVMYFVEPSADNLTLNYRERITSAGRTPTQGWIKIAYVGTGKGQAGDALVYFLTIDNLGTYRILTPWSVD